MLLISHNLAAETILYMYLPVLTSPTVACLYSPYTSSKSWSEGLFFSFFTSSAAFRNSYHSKINKSFNTTEIKKKNCLAKSYSFSLFITFIYIYINVDLLYNFLGIIGKKFKTNKNMHMYLY